MRKPVNAPPNTTTIASQAVRLQPTPAAPSVERSFQESINVDPAQPLPLASQLLRAAALLLLVGASVGATFVFATLESPITFALHNALPLAERLRILQTALAVGVSLLAVCFAVWVRRPTPAATDKLYRFARLLSPLCLLFPTPFLFNWRLWVGKELAISLLILIWALLLEKAFFTALRAGSGFRLRLLDKLQRRRLKRLLPWIIVGGLVFAFTWFFSHYTILRHRQLQTNSYDLGIFDNLMWNLIRGEWFYSAPVMGKTGSHIQYHATFIAYLLAPIYALRQQADTLLAIQAGLSGLAAVPLFLLVRLRLRSAFLAVAFVLAYLLYAPLHRPLFYDFHFLTISPVFVLWTLYFFEARKTKWLVLVLALALFVREDISVGLAAAFLFYILSGERLRWAFAGAACAAVYFVVVKFFVMPAHALFPSASFLYIYKHLVPPGEAGFPAVLRTLFTNPVFVSNWVLTEEKATYVLQLLVPLVLLPLRHFLAWIWLLPGVVLTLLSTEYEPVIQINFQYTSHWIPYVFAASAVVLSSFRFVPRGRAKITASVLAMLAASTAMSYQFGCLFQTNNFVGGFYPVRFDYTDQDERRRADLYSLIRLIPKHAAVAATEHEVPHVSNRHQVFTMRDSAHDAEYLLVNIAEVRNGPSRHPMRMALQTNQYGHVKTAGDFMLWKRGAPQATNKKAASQLGVGLPRSGDKARAKRRPSGRNAKSHRRLTDSKKKDSHTKRQRSVDAGSAGSEGQEAPAESGGTGAGVPRGL